MFRAILATILVFEAQCSSATTAKATAGARSSTGMATATATATTTTATSGTAAVVTIGAAQAKIVFKALDVFAYWGQCQVTAMPGATLAQLLTNKKRVNSTTGLRACKEECVSANTVLHPNGVGSKCHAFSWHSSLVAGPNCFIYQEAYVEPLANGVTTPGPAPDGWACFTLEITKIVFKALDVFAYFGQCQIIADPGATPAQLLANKTRFNPTTGRRACMEECKSANTDMLHPNGGGGKCHAFSWHPSLAVGPNCFIHQEVGQLASPLANVTTPAPAGGWACFTVEITKMAAATVTTTTATTTTATTTTATTTTATTTTTMAAATTTTKMAAATTTTTKVGGTTTTARTPAAKDQVVAKVVFTGVSFDKLKANNSAFAGFKKAIKDGVEKKNPKVLATVSLGKGSVQATIVMEAKPGEKIVATAMQSFPSATELVTAVKAVPGIDKTVEEGKILKVSKIEGTFYKQGEMTGKAAPVAQSDSSDSSIARSSLSAAGSAASAFVLSQTLSF